jgi:hypothetical protein
MILLVLLSVRQTLTFGPDPASITTFDHFTFAPGGTLFLDGWSRVDSSSFMLALYDWKRLPDLQRLTKDKKILCLAENVTAIFNAIVSFINGTASFQVLINESSVITPALSFCDNNATMVTITVRFENPNSKLSADYQPCLYIEPAVSALYCVLLIILVVHKLARHLPMTLLCVFITVCLILLVVDKAVFWGLLYHYSTSDDFLALDYFRMFTRAASVCFFFVSLTVSSLDSLVASGQPFTWQEVVGSFIMGAFLGIPLVFLERYCPPESNIWEKLLAGVWLYVCWIVAFALVQKRLKAIIERIDALKKDGIDHKSSFVWEQYMSAAHHLNLYAAVLYTWLMWVLWPFPELVFFWLSQLTFDVACFIKFTICFAWCLKRKQIFVEGIGVGPGEDEELQLIGNEPGEVRLEQEV